MKQLKVVLGLIAALMGGYTLTLPVHPEWSEQEYTTLRSFNLTNLAPAQDASNRVVHNPEAAALGQQIFFDPRFSQNGQVSCASCHKPEHAFTDNQALAQGLSQGERNTPSLTGVGYNTWFFWDGRKDSLWSQATAPFENPKEHGITRTQLVHILLSNADYQLQYQRIFGDIPDKVLQLHATLQASPQGDIQHIKAWKTLDTNTRRDIDTVFSNMGKVLAAYMNTLKPATNRLDRYVQQLENPSKNIILSTDELHGARLFMGKAQCINCHSGALLTHQGFQNIGTATAGKDTGRAAVLDEVRLDTFNCLGEFSDAPATHCRELTYITRDRHALYGAYKVPTLRQIALTAPYFHDGRMNTLEDVVNYYITTSTTRQDTDLPPITLSETEKAQLVAFLKAL